MTKTEYLKTFLEKIKTERPQAGWLLLLLEDWDLPDTLIDRFIQVIKKAIQKNKTERFKEKKERSVEFLKKLEEQEKSESTEADNILDSLLQNI